MEVRLLDGVGAFKIQRKTGKTLSKFLAAWSPQDLVRDQTGVFGGRRLSHFDIGVVERNRLTKIIGERKGFRKCHGCLVNQR